MGPNISDPELKMTLKQWAHMLNTPDIQLTLPQARLFVAMREQDYALETKNAMLDVQARVTRIELFLSQLFPTYNGIVRQEIQKALAAASSTNGANRVGTEALE